MLSRSTKRFISTKVADLEAGVAAAKKAAEPVNNPPPPDNVEQMRITRRRMSKAERDERMDITAALTPVKTYMGGFTKPGDFRASNWLPGGRYKELQKVYENPAPSAYEPHTVFLLESRYPVNHGIGRPDSHDHIVGVCREGDLPDVLAKFNSANCPPDFLESMDNARWPFTSKKRSKKVVWWEKGENPRELVRAALEGEADGETKHLPAEERHLLGNRATRREAARIARRGSGLVSTELLSSHTNSAGMHMRTFHNSVSRRDASEDSVSKTSTTTEERSKVPNSAWSRPHKPSQDANDDVVPTYYVERKKQRDMISERKEEEGGLMAELSAGILSDGIAAQTKVAPEKIPVEIKMADGTVRHPSGFEPPTPETEFHPVAAKTPTEDDPLLTTRKIPWDEALASTAEAEAQEAAAASKKPHASSSAAKRGFHSSAAARAMAVAQNDIPLMAPPASPVDAAAQTLTQLRERYQRTLRERPFWRPLLTLSFSTRPLALSVSRLSKSLPRGLPFYASIPEEERKHVASFDSRVRTKRLQRMSQLALDLTRIMAGQRGGPVGIRFSPQQRGRLVEGESADEHIALEKRSLKVGVAEWYPFANEVKETFVVGAEEGGVADAVSVFGIDQFGYRTDGVEWHSVVESEETKRWLGSLESKALAGLTPEERENLHPGEKKKKILEYAEKHHTDIARQKANRHYAVYYA